MLCPVSLGLHGGPICLSHRITGEIAVGWLFLFSRQEIVGFEEDKRWKCPLGYPKAEVSVVYRLGCTSSFDHFKDFSDTGFLGDLLALQTREF